MALSQANLRFNQDNSEMQALRGKLAQAESDGRHVYQGGSEEAALVQRFRSELTS